MKFNFKSILKSGIITNKPLHFYIILFVLMVVQTMLFEYIAPFEREPTFRKMLLIATADVAMILLPFALLPSKWRWTFGVSVSLYTFWILSNVWYARTYCELMPTKSYFMIENVSEVLIDSTIASVEWVDLLLLLPSVIIAILYYLYYRKYINNSNLSYRSMIIWGTIIFELLFNIRSGYAYYCDWNKRYKAYKGAYYEEFFKVTADRLKWSKGYYPPLSDYYFANGGVAFWTKELLGWTPNIDLTGEQKQEIEDFLNNSPKYSDAKYDQFNKGKNLIFVVVESLSSWVIDYKIEGKEVTPTFNSFFHDNESFTIRNVLSDVLSGRTSDGHFIYNTGLLPCKSNQTAIHFGDVPYPSIAKALNQKGYYSYNILCDELRFWNQQNTSKSYGFEKTYSRSDYYNDDKVPTEMIDSVILSSSIDYLLKNKRAPYYAMIVTLSLHAPWSMHKNAPQWIKDAKLKDEVKNYLSVAYFVDSQIKKFLEELKNRGMYDNSVIVLASDHEGLCKHVVDGRDKLLDTDRMIPVMILNAGINIKYDDVVGQVDIFPTLLDVMGANQYAWKGLGYSILRNNVVSTVSANDIVLGDTSSNLVERQRKAWNVSNMIIKSRYFEDVKIK